MLSEVEKKEKMAIGIWKNNEKVKHRKLVLWYKLVFV